MGEDREKKTWEVREREIKTYIKVHKRMQREREREEYTARLRCYFLSLP